MNEILAEIEKITGHPAEVLAPGSLAPYEVRICYSPKKWAWAQGQTPEEAAASALRHAKGSS